MTLRPLNILLAALFFGAALTALLSGWPRVSRRSNIETAAAGRVPITITCQTLRCCEGDAEATSPSPSSPPPAPPPLPPAIIPDGGPYPVRQRAVLPGMSDTGPYEYYAGFLDAGTPPSGRGRLYLHYICAMAPPTSSADDTGGGRNWTDMPLTLWYNGGPGAPSTYGLFQEFGPYLLTSESMRTEAYERTGVPTPMFNPWTWANVTSVCEIDSPGPIGASFCTEGNGTSASSRGGPPGDAYSCGPWTDKSTAAANHRAHKSFFRDAFPEFEESGAPVAIMGESYAGVYVPLFVDAWLDYPVVGPNGGAINLTGFAVGDGFPACIPAAGKPVDWCADLTNVGFFDYPNALPGPHWDVEFFHGHSQMSEGLYREIHATCTEEELVGIVSPLSAECGELVGGRMAEEVGLFHVYNLLEACPAPTSAGSTTPPAVAHPRRMFAGNAHPHMPSVRRGGGGGGGTGGGRPRVSHDTLAPSPGDGDTGLGAPCLGNALDAYLALNATKRGLAIPLDNNFIVLDNGIGFNYTTDAGFVGHVYDRATRAGMRVLVYEGDTDACGLQTAPIEDVWVPFFGNGTGVWTPMGRLGGEGGGGDDADGDGSEEDGGGGGRGTPRELIAPRPLGLELTQPWRPFSVRDGVRVQGGYVMEWRKGGLGDEGRGHVSFVSIRGAGHLAPLYRPAASFALVDAFHRGVSLPVVPIR